MSKGVLHTIDSPPIQTDGQNRRSPPLRGVVPRFGKSMRTLEQIVMSVVGVIGCCLLIYEPRSKLPVFQPAHGFTAQHYRPATFGTAKSPATYARDYGASSCWAADESFAGSRISTTRRPSSWRTTSSNLLLTSSPSLDDESFVQAEDLEALQKLFSKYCDSEGLMTKVAVTQIPAISDLMEDGDLLGEEFDDIWDRAPKFPDVESRSEEERIDVDSFVQVYRDIDDLFEDEDDDEDDGEIKDAVAKEGTKKTIDSSVSSPKANSGPGDKKDSVEPDLLDDEEPEEGEIMEEELESSFDSICDASNLVSKEALMGWDEVSKLLEDGLLGEDELDDLWEKTKKSPGSEDMLDVDGFLSFNVALDGLFDFEDEDEDDEDLDVEAEYGDGDDVEEEDDESASGDFVEGENLPKGELFDLLSNQSGRLNGDGLLRWTELREMLEDGDLLESELDSIFKNVSKDGKEINKDEFVALCGAIDELFEEDEDDGKDEEEAPVPPLASSGSSSLKEELLDMLSSLEDPDLLPCGLESSESEQRIVLELVTELERQETNLVRARGGNLDMEDLAGTWDLLYSSSSAMRYNKGLSGLGGSVPNGKFGGLKQKLKASKFMADVEYLEQINVTPSSASFEVKVTGDWDLRRSVSLFTGEPSLVLTVLPGQVIYGPTSTKADHWKSIGPLNMLDITYLDENLRIMRGNTAVENIFVFRRSS